MPTPLSEVASHPLSPSHNCFQAAGTPLALCSEQSRFEGVVVQAQARLSQGQGPGTVVWEIVKPSVELSRTKHGSVLHAFGSREQGYSTRSAEHTGLGESGPLWRTGQRPSKPLPVPRHGHWLSLEEVNMAGLFHHVPSCTDGAGQVSAKHLPGCPEGRERAWPVDGT